MSKRGEGRQSDDDAGPRNHDHDTSLREIFDIAPNGVIQVDFEHGTIKHANTTVQEISGFALRDLIGMRFDDLLDGRAGDLCFDGMVSDIAPDAPIGPYETALVDAAGAPLPVDVRGKMWPDAHGRQTLWCFICDLRDQKRKDTDMLEAQRRLADIIDAAQLGTFEIDVENRMNHINDRWADMLGYQRTELEPIYTDDFREMLHPDDRAAFDEQVAAFESGMEVFERDMRMRHKNGHYVWIFSRGRVTRRNRDGRPVRISGIHLDITEQKAREEALRMAMTRLEDTTAERDDARQRFLDITNVSNMWYWEQDSDLRFTYVSDNLEQFSNLNPAMLIGKTRGDLLEGNKAAQEAADWRGLARKVAAREPFRDFTYMVPGSDGQPDMWFRSSGAPFHDRDGQFAGYRGIGADVTELVESMKRAQAANRSKSQFLANMSHEIRTPLNGVLGMAELLESHIDDPEKLRMIQTIRTSGENLLNIINDLLDMSKVEAGRLNLENAPFRIDEILRRLEDIHLLKAEEKGLSFEVMIGSGCDAPRMGDSHRVQQILHNLLSNAIKFTEEGSVNLTVLARKDEPVKITVEDTGIGMTPEQVEQLFEDFVQADSSISRRFGGTGLGMSIVRQLLAMMDGKIDVDSTEGEGTIITVTLPLPMAANQDAKPEQREKAPLSFEGHRVLVADDNQTNRDLMAAMLQSMGAEFMLVNDGVEAVHAARNGKFDLILMDISMPRKDGVTALAEIREEEKALNQGDQVPVVAVTAHAMAHQVAEYVVAGFDTHLCKPFSRADLAQILSVMLEPRPTG